MLEVVLDKEVIILYPQDDAAERVLPPDSALRGRYLEQELRSLTSTKVAVVPIPVHEVDMDGRGHPTEGYDDDTEGTERAPFRGSLPQRRAGDLQAPLRRGPGGVPFRLLDLRHQGREISCSAGYLFLLSGGSL